METRTLLALCAISTAGYANQWEPSLATVSSLRTGGAQLASSDALVLGGSRIALITYWEVRNESDLDFYRCVDLVDSEFVPLSQECRRGLRPTGRGPAQARIVRSSRDICDAPVAYGGVGDIAYCSFAIPSVIRTPWFQVTVEAWHDEGLLAVYDGGRSLLVTAAPWPSESIFSVSAIDHEGHPVASGAPTTLDVGNLGDIAGNCEARELIGRIWMVCESPESPDTNVAYHIEAGIVYEVSYTNVLRANPEVEYAIERMFYSVRPMAIGSGTQ